MHAIPILFFLLPGCTKTELTCLCSVSGNFFLVFAARQLKPWKTASVTKKSLSKPALDNSFRSPTGRIFHYISIKLKNL